MLRPEVGCPELDLMKSIFYGRWSVCIRDICTGKFLSDFSKFEIFNAQELDDMTLFQVHRLALFGYLQFVSRPCPSVFPRENQNYHGVHEYPMAVAGARLSPARKEEGHEDKWFPNTL
jgi:hypothetical protein